MYPPEIREMRYKNNQNSMYLVCTSTYWYATRKVCTFSLKYVLLSWILYSVRTKYILIWEVLVRTWYVLGVKSTYRYVLGVKVRTRSLVQSSTRWYSTIACGVPTCTGTYRVRTMVHDSTCILVHGIYMVYTSTWYLSRISWWSWLWVKHIFCVHSSCYPVLPCCVHVFPILPTFIASL